LKAAAVNAEIRLGRLTSGFDAGGHLILTVERVLFVLVAIGLAMEGVFTIGMIFAFQAYKQQFLDASTRLVEQALNYRLLDVHLARISDIALSQPEVPAAAPRPPLARLSGHIELGSVGFRYGDGEPEILRSVSMAVASGETIALVGPSGGGKTTLLKIMAGLFQPNYGEVVVDGRRMTRALAAAFRQQIGYVAQDDMLYAGTLAENIAFFEPEIDMRKVQEVARLVDLDDHIKASPLGYETLVGDMGSTLSGGQRQRLLIARALYRDPAILFLDEATAHLDGAAELAILQALAKLPMTKIMTAHRPASIAFSSKAYLVKDGAVHALERHAGVAPTNF
jgi:ATP-binding cassette subfamily B protein RaxB